MSLQILLQLPTALVLYVNLNIYFGSSLIDVQLIQNLMG